MGRRVGIALGAGSAKGLAHLGVLRVLEENQVKISCIAGSSIGAVVGAAYAAEPDAEELALKAKALLRTETFAAIGLEFFVEKDHTGPGLFRRITDFVRKCFLTSRAATKPWLVSGEKIDAVLRMILPDIDIGQLKIPFACVGLDLATGKDIVFTSGPLIQAVKISMSIPGVFPYVNIDDAILVDGGVTASVPVDAAREMGAEFVIGVDLLEKMSRDFNMNSGLEINFRADEIAKRRLNILRAEKADLLIRPRVDTVHWADFSKPDFCIGRGREAALEAMPVLAAELGKVRRRRMWPFQYILDRRTGK